MKTILILLISFISISSFTQTNINKQFFGQCLINIEDESICNKLQDEIRLNPQIYIVRIDWNTKRVFILTKEISNYSIDDFISYFGIYSKYISCIQIGIYGTDNISPYPFTKCN